MGDDSVVLGLQLSVCRLKFKVSDICKLYNEAEIRMRSDE